MFWIWVTKKVEKVFRKCTDHVTTDIKKTHFPKSFPKRAKMTGLKRCKLFSNTLQILCLWNSNLKAYSAKFEMSFQERRSNFVILLPFCKIHSPNSPWHFTKKHIRDKARVKSSSKDFFEGRRPLILPTLTLVTFRMIIEKQTFRNFCRFSTLDTSRKHVQYKYRLTSLFVLKLT